MKSAALAERRIVAAARALEVEPEQLVVIVATAFRVWRLRHPLLRSWWAFRFFGRAFVNHFVAEMINAPER